MIIEELEKKKLISPPPFLSKNTQYLTIMGSIAYGVNEDTSDFDVYGYCIPPKEDLFPYNQRLYLFDHVSVFEQYQQHHVFDQDALGGKGREYDFSIYNIVKYIALCAEGNPNMVDSLFASQNCILHSTAVAEMIRDKRHLFLFRKMWPKFKGYAYSQLHKSDSKTPEKGSKRQKLREMYGMDTKYLYHVIRLLGEIEQILKEGDLDLQEKGRREHMKAIRRGEISEIDIRKWASEKEKDLEKLYHNSTIPETPPRDEIKKLLLSCIEYHYGSLDKYIQQPDWSLQSLRDIDKVIREISDKLY